jgi:hypothetical protein
LHTIIAYGVRERWQVPLPDILLQGDLFEARIMRGRIAARHLVPRELLIEVRRHQQFDTRPAEDCLWGGRGRWAT